ncbi:MAG: hypothetical protein A2309_09375 [Bacteroidetes bacterium RIFOXYB2_FULL_35_7]|nr:MAG: hypothetical protein A2X01_14865 [Bacteroidetes bacterium GWF2_35_48]OFY92891.1 MAG: hypothetical protein A2309_09375 [Bacteroidetes bacterium RIFOXYB2_FULL_35_7]HBX50129.1 hypothetical protein [Bacteroidales bacterium]
MNDIILENLIRKHRNKKAFKTIALALFNNLDKEERQKVFNAIQELIDRQNIFSVKFNLTS